MHLRYDKGVSSVSHDFTEYVGEQSTITNMMKTMLKSIRVYGRPSLLRTYVCRAFMHIPKQWRGALDDREEFTLIGYGKEKPTDSCQRSLRNSMF